MAFHVSCPITCRRICFCELGFPKELQSEKGRSEFLEEISRVEEFLIDPWSIRARETATVQVKVPRIAAPPPPPPAVDGIAAGDGDEALSAQTKRALLQRKAVEASQAAEDFARRFENGISKDISGAMVQDLTAEDQGSAVLKIMCRICFSGENEGSEGAKKMLPCKYCNKKYHRSCLRRWAEHRDMFHWSSWACPSCRICEVCRRSGDPNKFMFCKRCDGAYHCYCQHPPHKNVGHGPYLCPKHTRCHSCGSTVPGNGLSTRWFLGYTCCDACGRLFVKGNYCPVCLKVYRDSESTPMVCCDACQRWVHCQCDGISDEKYLQFQADGNLYYKCAACRGECYKVRDVDDAVQELWKRRDKADHDLIASLRVAAGLPSQDDLFSIYPYSDDEENGPVVLKSDYGRSLKFSVKGLVEKTPKNIKEYGKKSAKSKSMKYAKKKGYQLSLIGKTNESYQSIDQLHETQSLESRLEDEMTDDMRSHRTEGSVVFAPANARNPGIGKEKPSIKHPGIMNDDDGASKVLQTNGSKSRSLDHGDGIVRHSSKMETIKGTKLVIHLPGRNKNITSSPRSEVSSCHRDQDPATSTGAVNIDGENQLNGSKHSVTGSMLIKRGKVTPEGSEVNPDGARGNLSEDLESNAVEKTPVISGRKTSDGSIAVVDLYAGATLRSDEVSPSKHSKAKSTNLLGQSHDTMHPPVADSFPKDPKPLKLKFKNLQFDSQSSWVPQGGEEEKSSVKGQRSKRKRPSPFMEKAPVTEDEDDEHFLRENPIDKVMDANWILKKLGKDAIGKRVEVHQSSDNSWHEGVVTNMIEGSSALSVQLDDGRSRLLELGKQGVRLIPQKQKRSKS
ncbi:PHD finger family protein isoform 2 [Cinnamomum micranthum f. kanehirae]|uniref:PHD finger family protein isoform 2 n=1 Tax=Cinnamomum micranthum f. kanehirae TaxID=337451 RepID=A0A3S3MDE9_9MAGN|nr:PHD finger family protein isoform 2 [Cinnamomum micranthum f. kanehirae]